MNILARLYYRYKKALKVVRLYLVIAGPGIIVMVADNDAGRHHHLHGHRGEVRLST